MQDRELLRQFVQTRSEQAFAELVRRHMDAVYCPARRQVRDNQLAEDVAQAVFLILARKAGNLQDRDSIAGWLMKTARLASLDAIKIESRRKRHEQHAAMLAQSSMEQNMTPLEEISSEFDLALSRLNDSNRSVVTLRYLHGKTTVETADSLGISEPAAAKRIVRAVDRLRKILLARRAIAPTVALALLLEQVPRVAAPAALANNVVISAAGGSASAAGLSIAKGVLHMMTFHKIVAAVLLVAALAGITGVGVGTAKLLADQNAPLPVAPPPADLPPISSESLSNGASIDILGICESPSTGKQWWLANGDLLDTPPYAHMGAQITSMPGTIVREFAISVNDHLTGSADRATVRWSVAASQGSSSTTPQDKTGRPINDVDAAAVAVPDAPGGVTIKANVAAGKWITICTASGIGSSSRSGPNGSFLFSNTLSSIAGPISSSPIPDEFPLTWTPASSPLIALEKSFPPPVQAP
jgi:RNA polymerase sigma factor (sigma-70 family)